MTRRKTVNQTGIKRLAGIQAFDAWVSFSCVKCSKQNFVRIGTQLLSPQEAYDNAIWTCDNCGFSHSKVSDLPVQDKNKKALPFKGWGKDTTSHKSIAAQRFWKSFFATATESPNAYWKQCNTCGRILPAPAFSGHADWGPLEKQMECRSCKAVINANLNPKRTKEQLHEGSARRRIADLLLAGEHQKIDFAQLFQRFDGKCFRTGKLLNINNRESWAVDHILPSRFLYPLTTENAALLSKQANNNKRDKWPSEFYTNNELKNLAKITGANLSLISRKTPLVNQNIDVDRCVTRMLSVRGATDLSRRIEELKKLLADYDLVSKLSSDNKKLLGLT